MSVVDDSVCQRSGRVTVQNRGLGGDHVVMTSSPRRPDVGGRPGPIGGTTAPGGESGPGRGGGYEVRRHDVAADPPPEPGTFDLVHARLVLVHVPDRARALATMAAALRPGGWSRTPIPLCSHGPAWTTAAPHSSGPTGCATRSGSC
ncbi:MAG TPA: class I SAM-dependent methyltransferase [Actinoplanes sp.]